MERLSIDPHDEADARFAGLAMQPVEGQPGVLWSSGKVGAFVPPRETQEELG